MKFENALQFLHFYLRSGLVAMTALSACMEAHCATYAYIEPNFYSMWYKSARGDIVVEVKDVATAQIAFASDYRDTVKPWSKISDYTFIPTPCSKLSIKEHYYKGRSITTCWLTPINDGGVQQAIGGSYTEPYDCPPGTEQRYSEIDQVDGTVKVTMSCEVDRPVKAPESCAVPKVGEGLDVSTGEKAVSVPIPSFLGQSFSIGYSSRTGWIHSLGDGLTDSSSKTNDGRAGCIPVVRRVSLGEQFIIPPGQIDLSNIDFSMYQAAPDCARRLSMREVNGDGFALKALSAGATYQDAIAAQHRRIFAVKYASVHRGKFSGASINAVDDIRAVKVTSPTIDSTAVTSEVTYVGADGSEAFFLSSGRAQTPSSKRTLTVAGTGVAKKYVIKHGVKAKIFDARGRLISVFSPNGVGVRLAYSPVDGETADPAMPVCGALASGSGKSGIPSCVADLRTGRKMDFVWSANRLEKVIDPFGNSTTFTYEGSTAPNGVVPAVFSRLTGISRADGTSLSYVYSENSQTSGLNRPNLLTSTVDEMGASSRTWYDREGKAIQTEMSGGIGKVEITENGSAQLENGSIYSVDMLGVYNDTTWYSGQAAVLVSASQPAGAGCMAAVSAQELSPEGFVASRDDFSGSRVCFSPDPSTGLETARIEGLSRDGYAPASCSAAWSNMPVGARKVSTKWHPDWQIETAIAEPKKLTYRIFNGQPDPTSGNAIQNCAPSEALLPDGSRMAVLCKQVEIATTDATGILGFAAMADSSVLRRIEQWTYNELGQVLTFKDAMNNTTTAVYYNDTNSNHVKGDLASVTNALNQMIRFVKYDAAGHWLEKIDANGIATVRTFDALQRLKSVSTNSLTSSFDYWPTGKLKQITLPDASSLRYDYDVAQRLISVSDDQGNKVTYTLDASGNRIGETVSDRSGRLVKTLTRVPDALDRIQQIIGRE